MERREEGDETKTHVLDGKVEVVESWKKEKRKEASSAKVEQEDRSHE